MFYTQSLVHPSEDRLPVSTTLPIRVSSRACWAPDEAAKLMVIHRDDSGMRLVITTFELKANKSRDRVSILGKIPVLATAFSWYFRTGSSWFLSNSLFSLPGK